MGSRRALRASGGQYVVRSRGFPASTYSGDVVQPVLQDRTVDAVLRVWNAHQVQRLSDKADVWRFVFENMEVPLPLGPPPGAAAAAEPFAPAGAVGAAETSAGTASRRSASVRPVPGPAPAETFQPLPAEPEFAQSDLTSWGESVSFQMQRLGLPRFRTKHDASAPAGLSTDSWVRLPLAVEVPASGEKWDPVGGIWNRAGHVPMLMSLGDLRTRSAGGDAARGQRNKKKDRWSKGAHAWPWWMPHESEKVYWTPGGPSTGRGFSGYWWRWSQAGLTAEEARAKDAEWVALYGEAAYAQAVAATEWVLGLPFPPPAEDSFAPAGSPEHLAQRAAWGGPELWPAHLAPTPSDLQMRTDRLRGAQAGAVPRRGL